MDTDFKRIFDEFEKPFWVKVHRANMLYLVICVIFALFPSFLLGFNYSFSVLQIIIAGVLVIWWSFLKSHRFSVHKNAPEYLKNLHANFQKTFPKGGFLYDAVCFYAKKSGIKRKVLVVHDQQIQSIGVTTYKDCHVLYLTQDVCSMKNSEFYATVQHEFGHVLHGDIEDKCKKAAFFERASFIGIIHLVFINPWAFVDIVSILMLLLFWVLLCFIAILTSRYIERMSEYLADISSVKHLGLGEDLIHVLKMLSQGETHRDFVFLTSLGLATHPTFKEREKVLLQAQSLYDKHY